MHPPAVKLNANNSCHNGVQIQAGDVLIVVNQADEDVDAEPVIEEEESGGVGELDISYYTHGEKISAFILFF